MSAFYGQMSSNASADEAGVHVQLPPSFPFAVLYPDRHQLPPPAFSFISPDTTVHNIPPLVPMDQLSLHYSYLSLQEPQPALIPGAESRNFSNVAETVDNTPTEFPIHAPMPSPAHGAAFMQPDYLYQLENAGPALPEVFYTAQGHLTDAQNSSSSSSPESLSCSEDYQIYYTDGFSSAASSQSFPLFHETGNSLSSHETFLTPSELRLAELEAKAQAQYQLTDNSLSEGRVESASKARRRAMAKSIGFTPTDPDIISSHEKKRHYLECLEQYVMYLHEQFALVGVTPDRLERVAPYKGLSSKSIRTLLVHMENTTRKLNLRTQAEEQKYYNLSKEILQREGGSL